MKQYISLLRGINVGGHRRIIMADLKAMCIKIGFKNPMTYIQSGNISFESKLSDIEKIESLMSKAILKTFGHEVPVLVKSISEFNSILKNNPFLTETIDTKKLHITFLSSVPSLTDLNNLNTLRFENDSFIVNKDVIYLNIENPYHKTKLSNQFFEKKLNVSMTTRNWKTANKIVELASS